MKSRNSQLKKTFFTFLLSSVLFISCKKDKETETGSSTPLHHYYGFDTNSPADMELTADGDLVILGTSTPQTYSGKEIVVMKIDLNGNLLWKQMLGGNNDDLAGGLAICSNGDIVLTGSYSRKKINNIYDSTDLYVARLSSNGSVVWDSTYSYVGQLASNENIRSGTAGYDIACTPNGGFIVVGTMDSLRITDVLAIELDANGNRTSASDYLFGTFGNNDIPTKVELTSSGEYIMTTNTTRTNPTPVFVHFKNRANMLGNIVSSMDNLSYADGSLAEANEIIRTSESEYAAIGTTYQYNSSEYSNQDIYFMKLNSDLNPIGQIHKFGKTSTIEDGITFIRTNDGGFLLAGTTNDETIIHAKGKLTDIYLIKLNSSGIKEWERTYGTTEGEKLFAVAQTKNNGYAILSTMEPSGTPNSVSILLLNENGL